MKRLLLTLIAMLIAMPALGEWEDCQDADLIRVTVDGADVTVHHDSAYYNCCHDPFDYDVSWSETTLTLTQTEVHPMCFCLCCFDLATTVEDVPAGAWILNFRWHDYETGAWRVETVPFTVADLGQTGTAPLGAAFDSGCLSVSTGVDDTPPSTRWGQVKALYR